MWMMRIRRTLAVFLAAGLLALTLSTVASASTASNRNHSSGSSSVTISNEQGTTWACGFNPFNASVLSEGLVFGQIYEELVYVNSLKSGATTPWLASAYTWSNGNKTLTFTIRSGVKWSDGTPFTAKDVVFTFDLIKKFKALDLNSDWSVLSSVVQKGSNQVVFNFKTAAVPYFFYIADQTPIVPEHIWASIKNPVTYLNAKPVGTGAYIMSKCTPENVTYTKNPNYWQKGLPKIDTVYYPAFTSNDPANEELANGTAQWGSQFIPSIQSYYLSKNKDFHIWFPPIANVSIFPNLTNSLLSQLPVRQAMAYAIDRPRVSQIGEYGYEPASNQTSVVTPTFKSWLDTAAEAKYDYSYDPKRAISILEKAGYKMSGGVMTKDGKSLSFTMINIGGYSDWVASAAIIKQELAAVGIQVSAENLAATSYFAKLYTGEYQLAYGSETGGPTPYYELRQLLYSPNSAPIGQDASTNWERFSNKQVDSLINSYGATTSVTKQHQIVDSLEQVMLADVPVIPSTEEVDWYQYDTANIGGWPTPSNPYAQPAAYAYPDMGVVLLHLFPKS
jgi:peptide/nickel transport system substrate-binding protein